MNRHVNEMDGAFKRLIYVFIDEYNWLLEGDI